MFHSFDSVGKRHGYSFDVSRKGSPGKTVTRDGRLRENSSPQRRSACILTKFTQMRLRRTWIHQAGTYYNLKLLEKQLLRRRVGSKARTGFQVRHDLKGHASVNISLSIAISSEKLSHAGHGR